MRLKLLVCLALTVLCGTAVAVRAAETKTAEPKAAETTALRRKALAEKKNGNWKDAYNLFRKLTLNTHAAPKAAAADFSNGLYCLRRLNSIDKVDEFRDQAIAAHPRDWRLLYGAAGSLWGGNHYGYITDGKFSRGWKRGGGRYVNVYRRDRVRALRLYQRAMKIIEAEKSAEKDRLPADPISSREAFDFYTSFAAVVMGQAGNNHQSWRLQLLTDLSKLPDPEKGYYYGGGGVAGAPVDAEGNPVFHKLPKSWQAAASDGERWRWLLRRAEKVCPARANDARYRFASFLYGQFGVQTMAAYGYRFHFGRLAEKGADSDKDEGGPYAVHTLGEDETLAKLATGVKRFKLPKEFNYLRLFKEIAAGRSGRAREARSTLAQLFENRRQYDRAAAWWKKAGPKYTARVRQILDNWGRFEPTTGTQPAGRGATVEYRYRNGKEVRFTAYEVNVKKLLADVKAYLKSKPRHLNWRDVNVNDIGRRLMLDKQQKYLGRQVASWKLELKPHPKHFDRRVTVATPLQKPGTYLLKGEMTAGNTARIVLWVADTVIVKKRLDGKTMLFVADAVTGKPVAGATVDLFLYRTRYIRKGPHWKTDVFEGSRAADRNGLVNLSATDFPAGTNLLAAASTPEGRFAYLGFAGFRPSRRNDYPYNQCKTFCITDRPVYRPKQTVKFKFWINQAQYDREGDSPYARQYFSIRVNNPRGEKVFEKRIKADRYGGLNGEFKLPAGATLGRWTIMVVGRGGGGNFRVEEYKKPEFEVKIEAPEKPVKLGEKITVAVEARYYFGAPVAKGKIKYKVLRTTRDTVWYPPMRWDWLYGPGYWWFACDYDWYPGWRYWGCKSPAPWWWWGWNRRTPPEVVMQNEVPLGPGGKVKFEIDTALAAALHGDSDHLYRITAEVTDQSRRTIVGTGSVIAARRPFKVYVWVDRGHYRAGDPVRAEFAARSADGKPVKGRAAVALLRVAYDKNGKPVETKVRAWNTETDADGRGTLQLRAAKAGQYRLSCKVTDGAKHVVEGGYLFNVVGQGFDGSSFRFNALELIPDKSEYKPGDDVKMMINTNRVGGTVLLFLRPVNGVYLPPKVIRLKGKSTVVPVAVVKKDMPNFFVEAVTVADGKVHTVAREIVVPPENRVLNVELIPSAKKYKPGQKAKIKLKLTEPNGKPYQGSLVLAVYDKAVEYISGGTNVAEIKSFFWKWRRRHQPAGQSSLAHWCNNLRRRNEVGMNNIGVFGELTEATDASLGGTGRFGHESTLRRREAKGAPLNAANKREFAARASPSRPEEDRKELKEEGAYRGGKDKEAAGGGAACGNAFVEARVRTKFADTAFWAATLTPAQDGTVEVEPTMPENLTTWKIKAWAMGSGARVGQAETEVVTTKNLIIRLQAPRFFVQKDEVVLSANVHNYLKTKKRVKVSLELEGGCLRPAAGADAKLTHFVELPPKGEARVNWRVKATAEGEALIRMKALTDEESDATAMRFPVRVHGMEKTESFTGVIRPDKQTAEVSFTVPNERRPEATRLEVRWSPTLAGAMVDALPYLVDYPYGCTEQTLNRFLPTVLTQRVLIRLGVKLADVKEKLTNLNAQEIGDDKKRAADWKRAVKTKHDAAGNERAVNPVFDEAEIKKMVAAGVSRLASMQCADGGWGWFSGWGEHSYPHTTAYVVHGLQIAEKNDVQLPANMLERGVRWLRDYQKKQLRLLDRAKKKPKRAPWKDSADNLDAFVYMVLTDADRESGKMRKYLYRDRNNLAVYAKCMFALALHRKKHLEQRDMLRRNIEQFLVQDDENQTAYLKLPGNNYWWYWYGSEYEAQAYYLKLLAATAPKSKKASRLVKYLVNNRKHATYWNSTRDTAVCIEALAEYLAASGESAPALALAVLVDGKTRKEVKINRANLFTFDNALVLSGKALTAGPHKLTFKKIGRGPIYFNAYLTNFTLEDPITKTGLELKVERRYYRLKPVKKTAAVGGSRGQAVQQRVEKYEREKLKNLAELKSGELVEIELVVESKNDYEYLIFEDPKAAGFEPVDVRSGYVGDSLYSYRELRDEKVCFFVRRLPRGKHSLSYRMRAEIPGRFSALPTRVRAMYAPELKANADEMKVVVKD